MFSLRLASILQRASLVALFLCPGIRAQTFTGSIGGRVTDPTGLTVSGVEVVTTEAATNETLKTVTNEDGAYSVAFLKPGIYKVTFRAKGFKEVVQSNLELQLNQSFRLDQVFEVGSVGDSIEVIATASLVNFDSPEIAHVVGAEQLANIPELVNPGRGSSPFLLAKLLPGVVSTSSTNSNINNFSFGGGRPDTNEILIDGLPTTNPSDNTYTFTPSPDSVDEFKVITSAFSAEFGHTGGGILLATSKHGTNDFHGSVYEYFRNRILNARSFFQANNNQRYIQNEPGFTLGGPVLLPGYNGRNKTFFFADYNETLATMPADSLQLTPTAAERTGNFSQTKTGGANVTIYDPQTTTVDGSGNITRQPFPGNDIPASRIDPVAAKIAAYYPSPNGSFQAAPTTTRSMRAATIRSRKASSASTRTSATTTRSSPAMGDIIRTPARFKTFPTPPITTTRAVGGTTRRVLDTRIFSAQPFITISEWDLCRRSITRNRVDRRSRNWDCKEFR